MGLKPVSVDIEELVQWAIGQTGALPWARDREDELAFDRGLDAKPRRRPAGSWTLAEACAGLRFASGRPLLARKHPSSDAEKILAAIRELNSRSASLVIACGRSKIRPDWTVEGKAAAEMTVKKRYPKKRGKRRGRPVFVREWHPDPKAICAARETYTLWRAALHRLAGRLDGTLSGFRINGFAAPELPWQSLEQKAA